MEHGEAGRRRGVYVTSRAVALDPPAESDVPLFTKYPGYGSSEGGIASNTAALTATATVVGLAMQEICLPAGPAVPLGAALLAALVTRSRAGPGRRTAG